MADLDRKSLLEVVSSPDGNWSSRVDLQDLELIQPFHLTAESLSRAALRYHSSPRSLRRRKFFRDSLH